MRGLRSRGQLSPSPARLWSKFGVVWSHKLTKCKFISSLNFLCHLNYNCIWQYFAEEMSGKIYYHGFKNKFCQGFKQQTLIFCPRFPSRQKRTARSIAFASVSFIFLSPSENFPFALQEIELIKTLPDWTENPEIKPPARAMSEGWYPSSKRLLRVRFDIKFLIWQTQVISYYQFYLSILSNFIFGLKTLST